MVACGDFLKFLCILKKRIDGGFDHYHSREGRYWAQEMDFLAAHGFKTWPQVYEAGPGTLKGFVACQMRPPVRMLPDRSGGNLYAEAQYDAPFDQWKFAFRHQPAACPVPDWVCVGEARAECVRLLPKWAEHHLVYHGCGKCEAGMAVVALGDSSVTQSGGTVWAYGSSTVFQQPGCGGNAFLHDNSTGFICSAVLAGDHSRIELSGGGRATAHDFATVILRPGPDGLLGRFAGYGSGVKVFRVRPGAVVVPGQRVADGDIVPETFNAYPEQMTLAPGETVNMPFGCAVD